jgi:hypothetical protein
MTKDILDYFRTTIKGDSFKCNDEKFIIFKDFPLVYNPSDFQLCFKFKIFKNLQFKKIRLLEEDFELNELNKCLIKSTRILLIELNYNKKC